MKVYLLPNLDGVHQALVAARNQKEACKLLGSSLNGFRAYGGQVTKMPDLVALALERPGVVWQKRIESGPKQTPWVRARQ